MKTSIITSIILVTSQFIFAQSTARKVDSICQSIAKQHPEVGISIGLIDHGKEYFFNYGKISKESKLLVDENTIYEIGSITKLFTGNLLAQASDEGKLKIDDFIDNYLPNDYILSNEIKGKLKISDLASHQSGLPEFDLKKLMALNPKQPLDITKEVNHSLLNENTVLIDYGNYRYSNFSYVLLGMILEHVYGKNFESILKEKIFSQVKMNQTLTTDFNTKNQVIGSDSNGVQQDFFNWNPITAPAGLIKSNTSDLIKFLKTILSDKGKIAKATSITETTFFKNTEREIGIGQQMERNANDIFYYKTGNTFGCATILAYDKKSNWGLVILLNQNNSKLIGQLFDTSYEQVLKKK